MGGLGPKKMVKPKMDLAKALATMGFGTARIVDAHGERDAQDELNDALTRLMPGGFEYRHEVQDLILRKPCEAQSSKFAHFAKSHKLFLVKLVKTEYDTRNPSVALLILRFKCM